MVLEEQRDGEGERTREVQKQKEKAMRLIDADELMANITARCKNCNRRKSGIGDAPCKGCGVYDAIEWICAAGEVDAVPVVRCKDCKWWDKKDESPYGYCHACKHGHWSEHWEISIYRTYKGDWYCADGERKEKE